MKKRPKESRENYARAQARLLEAARDYGALMAGDRIALYRSRALGDARNALQDAAVAFYKIESEE